MKKRRRPDTRRADGSAARAAPGRALQASTGQPIPVGTAAGEPGRDRLPRRFRARAALFALLCAACFGIAGGYVALTVWRADAAAGRASAGPVADAGAISMLGQQPRLVFLDSAGDAYRRVAVAPLGGDGERQLTTLQCQRVHVAAGQGLCLGETSRGGAFTFDDTFQRRHSIQVAGVPSRVRISPDGRHAALTVFVTGHSYSAGGFSTQTTLVDLADGTVLGDLEGFTIWRDGARFHAPDFNFWGVTFARDGNRFYATLGSGGATYLIEGDLAAREARVLRDGVECPSLSPDNSRLAFKKRVGSGLTVTWQLALLDLATLTETPLSAEPRNVDDQVEWLDDQNILYFLQDQGPPATIRPDVWALPVDGGPPRLLYTRALSPAVVR